MRQIWNDWTDQASRLRAFPSEGEKNQAEDFFPLNQNSLPLLRSFLKHKLKDMGKVQKGITDFITLTSSMLLGSVQLNMYVLNQAHT